MTKIVDFLKYLPWLLIVILFAGTTYWQYTAAKDARALVSLKNKELLEANLKIGRAQTELVNIKQLHNVAIKDLDIAIQREIKQRNALIQSHAKLEALYEQEKKNVKTITRIVYKDKEGNNTSNTTETPTLLGQLFTKEEDKFVPVTNLFYHYKDFRITITGDYIKQELSYSLHQRFQLKLTETLLPGGQSNYYAELVEINPLNNETYKLKIEHFIVMRGQKPEASMFWWNPKLDLALGFGLNTTADFKWMGELGFSMSGYGITKNDLKWRFVRIGIGLANKENPSLSFSPIQYNLGQNLPLISNCWVFPYIGYDLIALKAHFGAGLSVVF